MPNYEVEVKVTLQLDADEPQTPETIRLAAKQAVSNALQFAYDNGFAHDLADDASIGVADVEVTAVDAECDRCGSNLDTAGKCTDATCAFSDHIQSCPAGWAGHPEHPSGRCTCNATARWSSSRPGKLPGLAGRAEPKSGGTLPPGIGCNSALSPRGTNTSYGMENGRSLCRPMLSAFRRAFA